MNKIYYRILLAVVAMIMGLSAQAAIPAGYYNSLYGKSGQALKDAIHDLAIQHTVLGYGALWHYFPATDCYPDDVTRVWDMYSDYDYRFNGTSAVSGMNKEHSFPKSWWGGSTDVQAYTDLNHLYPSDGPANMAKSNYPLGVVSNTAVKGGHDNGVSKVGTPVAGQGGGASIVFEPDDRYKGDFARTYFYMACAYQDYNWRYTYMVNNGSWTTLNPWAVTMLLSWARQDPVSDKETRRNDAVQRYQNNRNPFIDFPTLFEYIWGSKQGEVFNGDSDDPTPGPDPTATPELVSPTQGSILDMGEVALGKSLTATLYVKGVNLNNSLSLQLYRWDYQMFSIPVTSVDRVAANSEEGYPLVITYTPTAVGEHKAKLLVSDGGLVGSYGAELHATCVPVPELSQITALPATDVTDDAYTISWEESDDVVDYYIVTRTVYDGTTIVSSDEYTTDATEYTFTDRRPEYSYTHTVQSYRLGYTSVPSNVITLDATGISGIEADRPAAFLAINGGVVVKCSEPLEDVAIYNIGGQLVQRIAVVDNDQTIELPRGVYIMQHAHSRTATKLVVR